MMETAETTPQGDLDLLRATCLTTARYRDWRPEHGTPVRTTVGAPRAWRGPQLENARVLAPFGLLDDQTPDRYLARLDGRSDQVVAELAAIARRHPGERLCLLCFENVRAGQVCHRRWFAGWIEDRYGIEVPELAEHEPRLF